MAEKKKKKGIGGKAATSAVAAVTAAGVMVGGAMSSPDDTMNDSPDAIVQTVSMAPQVQVDAGGSDGGAEEAVAVEEEKKRGKYASVRKAMREAPFEVRMRLAIPLWIAGSLMISVLGSLLMGVLPPLAVRAVAFTLSFWPTAMLKLSAAKVTAAGAAFTVTLQAAVLPL